MKNLLIDQLKRDEGFSDKMYKDTVGMWTIGYGTNLDIGISEEEAEYLLQNRVNKVIDSAEEKFSWFKDLSLPRQAVVINMVYNLGIEGFSKFNVTIDSISKGRYEEAAKHMMDSKWATQVKGRARRLAEQMKLDKWVIDDAGN